MASTSMAPQGVPTLKILLVGSSSVGKSSLLLRYTDDEYLDPDEATATIGVDYKKKTLTVSNKLFNLNIWDTAGQERFRTLTSSYYRGAHGVIVVYDVANRESFDALPTWLQELDTFTSNTDVVKIIVGNKVDKDYARVVTEDEGRAFAQARQCLFVECSAKKGQGVTGAFDDLVHKIVSTPSLWQDSQGPRPGDRMPGGAPADHAATSSRGNISLSDPAGNMEGLPTLAMANGGNAYRDEGALTSESNGSLGAGFPQTIARDTVEEVDNEAGEANDSEESFLDPSLLHEATLPISNISRLMKKALPRQAKVSSSAKDLIQACCIEFISFLTSEANDRCLTEKRKTINGDDILFAMKALSFDEYEVVCRIWLTRYRMALEMSNRLKERDGRGRSTSKMAQSRASMEDDYAEDVVG